MARARGCTLRADGEGIAGVAGAAAGVEGAVEAVAASAARLLDAGVLERVVLGLILERVIGHISINAAGVATPTSPRMTTRRGSARGGGARREYVDSERRAGATGAS